MNVHVADPSRRPGVYPRAGLWPDPWGPPQDEVVVGGSFLGFENTLPHPEEIAATAAIVAKDRLHVRRLRRRRIK